MQFMVHVAYQQRVTDCRAALTDSQQVWKYGKLSHLEYTDQGHRVERAWVDLHTALEDVQENKLWGLGLIARGLP